MSQRPIPIVWDNGTTFGHFNYWITPLKSLPNEREIALIVRLFIIGEYVVQDVRFDV